MQQGEREYDFIFSVIVPVYKTEAHVEETIQSVIGQTIGFEKNIQLILVNNATPDNAGEICKRYRDKYPDNVVYVELEENRGPSGARNAGIPYIRGKYVNFLDSDDKWDLDAFEKVYAFFEKHYGEVHLVACRMKKFDADSGWYLGDNKFNKSGVYDIRVYQTYQQFNASSVFLKEEILESHRFDEMTNHSEDMKFLNEIIITYMRIGFIREAVFQYRKRKNDSSSLTQINIVDPAWYSVPIERSYLYLIRLSNEKCGCVIPYVQYLIMQEVAWRIWKETFPSGWDRTQYEEYIDRLSGLLRYIDDYVIATVPYLWKEYRLRCLQIKYGDDVLEKLECRNGKLYFHNLEWCSFNDPSILTVVEHHVENGALLLDGKINLPFPQECYEIFARGDGGTIYPFAYYPGDQSNVRLSMGEPCLVKRCFRVSIPLEDIKEISFHIRWDRVERELKPNFGMFAKLTEGLKSTYCCDGGYLFTLDAGRIRVEPETAQKRKEHERNVRRELLKKRHKRALALRLLLPAVRKRLGKKKLWVFSDRPGKAGDNGEYMFRYMHGHPQQGVVPVFAVSKASPDWRRMKRYGKVVDINSFWYQLLFLAADKVISSTWGFKVDDPFGWHRQWVRDLLRYQYIYLDHALTKDDISADTSKHQRNFAMWTTGAQMETDAVLRFPYGYLPSVPRTTGLARYDAIWPAASQAPKKQIMLAPTWRKSLAASYDKDGAVNYNEAFRQSDFFQFYDRLMNDPKLLDCMRVHGYTGVLKLHPLIAKQTGDFTYNDVFSPNAGAEAYEKEFFANALVVTDYSSIAMDYSFANRAVIYAQYDKEEFYRTHSYHESYFDYEEDGFGPVCYDYESTVEAIVKMVGQACAVEEKYRLRRERFFVHLDDRNCERICKELCS